MAAPESTLADDRIERERAFHDDRYEDDHRGALGKYYRIAQTSDAAYREAIRCADGETVLEYGCGRGSVAFDLAPTGASIIGIDISAVGVREAQATAAEQGWDNLSFREMNAEDLDLDDDSVDLICGSGILHHLDLGTAYGEISRVLRPGGRAVFFEPLGHNPLINLYRRLTPDMRTEDETPLKREHLRLAERYFGDVRVDRHHLTAIGVAALPADHRISDVALAVAERVDRVLLALPLVRHLAWIAVIELRRPRP